LDHAPAAVATVFEGRVGETPPSKIAAE